MGTSVRSESLVTGEVPLMRRSYAVGRRELVRLDRVRMLRRVAQWLGLVYQDDGRWRIFGLPRDRE